MSLSPKDSRAKERAADGSPRARPYGLIFKLGILVGLLALVALGCAEESKEKAEKKPQTIRISGSDDVYPLAKLLAKQFEDVNRDFHVLFAPPTHTRGGAAGIVLGDSDIGLLSRPLTQQEKNPNHTYFHLAEDILVFATHPTVRLKGLSRQQILDIYAGKITNWKEVGGPDAPIVVLDLPDYTSSKIVLRQVFFGPDFKVTPKATLLHRPDDMMTSIQMMKHSIGYISLGSILMENAAANILRVNGVEPSLGNFQKGLYPYTRPFGFVVGPNPTKATMRFVNFIYSDEGRRIMMSHGFAPVTMDLVIAVQPEQDLLAQEQRYAPLVEYLRRHLGLRTTVKLRLVPNYSEAIRELRSGGVNAAFLGSLAFGLAYAQADIVPLVRPEKDGVSTYRGLIVTRKDSGIQGPKDLKGKVFGMVDKATTAGYIYPLLWFRQHGIERPEDFLGSVVFTGSHDLLFLKVYRGELDAGGAKDLMLEEVAKTHPEVKRQLRVLAVSKPVPNNTFVMNKKLEFTCFRCHKLVPTTPGIKPKVLPREPEELKGLLADILLNLHKSEEGRRVLDALGADRFIRTTVEDLRNVNEMLTQAGFNPATYMP